ncbi:unnamed protein product [Rhizoctonia solani]|uniref:Uncharacterized protein n=1 Tax=Rhizoctonia solani TaxID=456999 RepID=A0A8H3E0E3_9AGAM|nr:unnamed protein product [Rhizoctonia solani]
MSRPQQDSSRRTLSSPNYVSRSTAHKAEGRLRIDFKDPVFKGYRERWGRHIYFWSIEYRKLHPFPEHEFILLKDLTDNPTLNPSAGPSRERTQVSPDSGTGKRVGKSLRRLSGALSGAVVQSSVVIEQGLRSVDQPTFSPPAWALRIPEDINNTEYVLKLERQANPETQANSAHRTEAYDFADLKTFGELSENERNSSVELAITFPQAIALEEVFKICSSISQHRTAQQYTLRQYNCYFFAWCITTMLVRLQMHYDWVRILRSDARETTRFINRQLVELSDPQRLHDTDIDILPNLTLLLSGEYNVKGTVPDTQRPFIRRFSNKLVELSTFERIASSLLDQPNQPLWAREQRNVIREIVRELLEKVADSTMDLATAGTGESNVVALFWSNTNIRLSDKWDGEVRKERNRLLNVYVDRMWVAFREALEQTSQAERQAASNQTDQSRPTPANLVSLIQRIGNSPTVLAPRLIQIGVQAAWNAAGVAAEARQPSPQTAEARPPSSRGQSFQQTMRRLQYTPGQIANVAQVKDAFIDVLSARREQVRVGGGRRQPGEEDPLSLDISNVLRMMGNINLQPQEEDRVVLELERSVKNMAAAVHGPDFSVEELRRAALELLLRLRQKAIEVNFGLAPDRTWRVCVWITDTKPESSMLATGCWERSKYDERR